MLSRRPRILVASIVAGWNGLCTLVLLLIAPLGLAAVLTLTLLITLSSFAGFLGGTAVMGWLQAGDRQRRTEGAPERRRLRGADD